MDINRQASERTGRVMLLFIYLVFLIRDSETCNPVEIQHTLEQAPTLSISTIEFPDERVLPFGSNVTIICTSNASKENFNNPYNAQPYWMQFYFNDNFLYIKQCGGRSGDGVDNEASKVCTSFIENATKSDSGNYTCWSYNQMSCTQGTIQLDFQEPLPPTLNGDLPRQLNVFAGRKANLTCQASGIPRPTITWFKNGHRLPRSSVKGVKGHSMLTFEPIRRDDAGEYWCETNSSAGWNRSSTATLTVSWKPIFTTHPKSNAVYLNNDVAMVTLQCAAEGLPLPVISWLKNNSTVVKEIAIQNVSVSSLDLVFHEKSTDDLKYRCVARNSAGKTLSKEATLTIVEKPAGNIEASTVSLPKGNIAASSTDSLPKFLWPLVGIVVVTILVLLIIFIVMKQKWWNKANSQRNLELVKAQHEFIQLQIVNGINVINQLRNSHSDSSMNSAQDGTLSTTDGKEELIDSELYLQGMDTVNRNWEIPRNRLVITEEKLGGGEFGIVTKGVYLRTDGNELPVAVKRLKDGADQQERIALIRELEILIHVGRHHNIVSLVGACTFEEPLCVVIEFVSGGSLDVILRSSHAQSQREDSPYANIWSRLTERELLKIASDVAKGMRYLESKQCIHRDLASRNVLVGNGLVAKVADFGMSRDISTDKQYIKTSQGRIPWLWMSLEALRGISTIKGDVWSFGVVLWEIVTLGELPYKELKGLIELHELLLSGVRLGKPAHCSQELYDVMLRCWQHSPDDRPSFEELHVILQEILDEKERTYINITFFEEQEDVFRDSTTFVL